MQKAIEINQVSKLYHKNKVVADVSLDIEAGKIYGLIGPSGAGKTTLVKMIVGMAAINHGSIRVLGEAIPNLKILQKIGYMAQSDALYSELTGIENLRFFAALYLLNKAEQKARIQYTANLVGLSKALKKPVSAYSGGMKRRLSLAIALIQDPQIIILDEPTVGIDPALRASIWEELFRLKEAGKTIIVTTHVMSEAERCDQVAMIRSGQIIEQGSPQTLKAKYQADNFDQVFLRARGPQA